MRLTKRTPDGVCLREGITCTKALERLAAAEDALDGLSGQLQALEEKLERLRPGSRGGRSVQFRRTLAEKMMVSAMLERLRVFGLEADPTEDEMGRRESYADPGIGGGLS